MRFHGLMLLRDEGDIIESCLKHLGTWIDALYVLDLGSTDETWDVLNEYASKDSRIVPFKRDAIVYNDTLRCILFDQYRDRFESGDWIMKIDADEIYHVPPPQFAKERLRSCESMVQLEWYFFRLTTGEVADYESGKVDLATDRLRPIEDRRRFYKISTYAEPRMFKYRRTMRWPENSNWPYNMGYTSRERIPVRHYPHRDPLQMQRRFKLRAAMMQRTGSQAGSHWKVDDWRKEVVDSTGASTSQQGQKVGLAAERGIDTGPLLYWQPGTELIEQPLHNHIPTFKHRAVQTLLYRARLAALADPFRQQYDKKFWPSTITEAENNAIGQAMLAP